MSGMIALFLLLTAFTFAGGEMQESKKGGDAMAQEQTVAAVLQRHTTELMKIPGVVGTGEGVYRGKPCILVFVKKKSSRLVKKIPKTLEGFAVIVREVGKVKPLK